MEDTLTKLDITLEPLIRIPYSMVALQIASQTDLLLVVSHCMLKQIANFPLVVKPVPFDKAPRSVAQCWHAQYHNELAHQWLRQRIKLLTEKL